MNQSAYILLQELDFTQHYASSGLKSARDAYTGFF